MVTTARQPASAAPSSPSRVPRSIERAQLRFLRPRRPNGRSSASPLEGVGLTRLMERSEGSPDVLVALLDGPIVDGHPDLASERIDISHARRGSCERASSAACMHGTFVGGMLSARRGSAAPAICPGCTLLIRPIFAETVTEGGVPSATAEELVGEVIDASDAGARIINISAAVPHASSRDQRALEAAFGHAASRGAVVVAAAGNNGTVGGSVLGRQLGVLPVVACDITGRPVAGSTLGRSIGRQGISAPGDAITSLGTGGTSLTLSGSSAAAPFVTGTIALLWSEFPAATQTEIRFAVARHYARRRTTVVPPLLDAWAAYRMLARTQAR